MMGRLDSIVMDIHMTTPSSARQISDIVIPKKNAKLTAWPVPPECSYHRLMDGRAVLSPGIYIHHADTGLTSPSRTASPESV